MLTNGVNAIVWSNNAEVKLYVYCDIGERISSGTASYLCLTLLVIVTHLQLVVAVVKPMSTLIIIRRLYLIASLKSVELPDKAEVRNIAQHDLEFLGLILSVISS